ncbi:restriction endonuclease subunit S [uncultured Thiohalocapsa sp.]|uniref:restriction endonuclease subunit S n=1 Tax=uncultured Thiohalocapsa sp. TaxID=768990 RepID=UPI0025D87E24|nr:restriction endonuclease subunit S [uncultured Thiohalocapsa sp.]
MSDWVTTSLGEFATLQRGHDLPEHSRHTGDVPVIGSFGITGTHSEWVSQGPGVTVGRSGASIGVVSYVERDYWPLNTCLYVTDFHGNNRRFVYYFLKTLNLANFNSGSAQPSLNRNYIHPISIHVPRRTEQDDIAALLGALDDKIELNHRTNETLEALARAIFKDWFVDFGPTRDKADGRAPYLAPALWSLFPDRLDAEGKPEGWTRERIGEHVKAAKGLSYKGSGLTTADSGMPLHNLNSVLEGGGYKTDGLKFYAGDYKPKHTVRPGDLIVANTEQGFDHLLIGYSAIVPRWTGKEALFSHHLYRVEPLSVSPVSRIWLHFALSASWIGDVVRRFSNGTTVNMLPADAFALPEITVPNKEIVRAFDGLAEPLLSRQEDSFCESQTLAQTRDLLLPKLMSGEIRLRDAERMVEDAA